VFLGDSILRRLREQIYNQRRRKGSKAIGLCVGGQSTSQLIRRMKRRYLKKNEKMYGKNLVILIGTNDILKHKRLDKLKHLYKWLLSDATKLQPLKVTICTLPPIFKKVYAERVIQTNDIIRSVAEEFNIELVDLNNLLNDRRLFER